MVLERLIFPEVITEMLNKINHSATVTDTNQNQISNLHDNETTDINTKDISNNAENSNSNNSFNHSEPRNSITTPHSNSENILAYSSDIQIIKWFNHDIGIDSFQLTSSLSH